jgi:uncharacterized coiled-coil protein SlyX
MNGLWGKSKDVLTVLVIPLVLWGVKLETTAAVQKERITELSKSATKADDMRAMIHANSVQLASLEAKLDAANGRLDVIKDLLAHD